MELKQLSSSFAKAAATAVNIRMSSKSWVRSQTKKDVRLHQFTNDKTTDIDTYNIQH